MVIAAFIISILAALFSGWQAVGQHRSANYERDRRHKEREPEFTADSYMSSAATPIIRLRLKSPSVLSGVTVRIVTPGLLVHRDGAVVHSRDDDAVGSVVPGKSLEWRVNTLPTGIRTVDLLIDCAEGDEKWTILKSVDLAQATPPGAERVITS